MHKVRKRRSIRNQIPESIAKDERILNAMKKLPWNYNFEILKTIWKIKQAEAKRVALQFPEGLLMYACTISDILKTFTKAETIVMADVTYGACCVDDLTAKALGADFMVHYGHSCLVPIDITSISMLYVFVTIEMDTNHLAECMKLTFKTDDKLVLMGTIQFATGISAIKKELQDYFTNLTIPQAKPLSPGEVLGCTSPNLGDSESLVFVADGRFHLESAMIANPSVKAYRYDPYAKLLTIEEYDTPKMMDIRQTAIHKARHAKRFGIILGTLGRQGNVQLLDHFKQLLHAANLPFIVLLLSEIFPEKLQTFNGIDAWIQIACPRLSIDWGYAFDKPLLSPYEAEVCLQQTTWRETYPMDYYAKDSGPWTNYHKHKTTRTDLIAQVNHEEAGL